MAHRVYNTNLLRVTVAFLTNSVDKRYSPSRSCTTSHTLQVMHAMSNSRLPECYIA